MKKVLIEVEVPKGWELSKSQAITVTRGSESHSSDWRIIEPEAAKPVQSAADSFHARLAQEVLDWRGIGPHYSKPLCDGCGGSGYKIYGSTSTWRRGIGGQAMTSDVCDTCWGSGTTTPWPSHRKAKEPPIAKPEQFYEAQPDGSTLAVDPNDLGIGAIAKPEPCDSAEDRFEKYIQAQIDAAPEPLKRLGSWLGKVLDDDKWPTAERFLHGACVEITAIRQQLAAHQPEPQYVEPFAWAIRNPRNEPAIIVTQERSHVDWFEKQHKQTLIPLYLRPPAKPEPQAVPGGYKLAPIKADNDMISAAYLYVKSKSPRNAHLNFSELWSAYISAVVAPPAAQQAVPDEWQPIETIPVDKYVDVWLSMPNSNCGGIRITQCAWLSNNIWSGQVGAYPLDSDVCKVTHWMHMPAAPILATPPAELSSDAKEGE